ncbi:MAG: FMN-binding protein [Melioribacteraceae bacterium]|nr:FMN-binding protein [Melioribacteraceae bacterium]
MRILYSFSVILIFTVNISANEIKERCESIISEYFKNDVQYSFFEYTIEPKTRSEIEIKCQQRFLSDKVIVWEIRKADSIKAYAVLDNVYGKSLPITFLVIFNPGGSVLKSDIIKYREPFGGGVANENWQQQFTNKNKNSAFDLGSDIHVLSGATISSRSVTKGIQKLVMLIGEISKNNGNKIISVR